MIRSLFVAILMFRSVFLLIFADGLKDTFLKNILTEPFFRQRHQWLDFEKWLSSDWDQFFRLLVLILGFDFVVILGQYQIKTFEFYEFFWFFGFLVESDKRLK